MTVEEKRDVVNGFCRACGYCRTECVLLKGNWRHSTVFDCLNIDEANEEELDRALELIKGHTDAKYIGCEYCKHMSKGEAESPCLYCKHNKEFGSEEYMTAPEFYELSTGEVLPVRRAEGIKSAATVIQLEVKDNSPMQIAYAIRNYIWEYYGNDYEIALIALDELTEHIDAYVRAERKALEYKKLAEED